MTGVQQVLTYQSNSKRIINTSQTIDYALSWSPQSPFTSPWTREACVSLCWQTTTSFYSPVCYSASIVGGIIFKPDSLSVDLPIVKTLHRQTPHTSKRSGLGVEPFKNNGLCSDWSELFSSPQSVAWSNAAQHAQQQEKLTNSEDISTPSAGWPISTILIAR